MTTDVTLKLLSYNIRYGGGGREAQLAAVIRDVNPDLVVFQEATRPQVIERLAAETGMKQWAARPGHSLGFMSRREVSHYEWHSPPGTRHSFLEVVPTGDEFRVFGLHLSAVHASWRERRRVRELRALLEGIKRYQAGFHALVGDFNTLAPGEPLEIKRLPMRLRPFVWLSGGRIRWEAVQVMLDAGYTDGYRLLSRNAKDDKGDKGFTFPTWAAHLRLDYIFLPAAFTGRLQACEVIRSPVAALASDHFPLAALLKIS